MNGAPLNLSDLKLNTFKRGDQVAPHKPLLILLALSRLQMGEPRLLTYQELEPDLKELLTRFSNSATNPQYPFWRLRGDMGGKLWDIPRADDLHPNKSGDVSPKDLIDLNIKAGFTSEIFDALKSDPKLLSEISQQILDNYFPPSLHEDIRDCLGLSAEWYKSAVKRKRDPKFAKRILELYRYSCAVCQYGARLGHAPIGIEAAHIKWHSYNGPDHDTNGLALCSIHHKVSPGVIRSKHAVKSGEVKPGGRNRHTNCARFNPAGFGQAVKGWVVQRMRRANSSTDNFASRARSISN